jgi:hypothetical protein
MSAATAGHPQGTGRSVYEDYFLGTNGRGQTHQLVGRQSYISAPFLGILLQMAPSLKLDGHAICAHTQGGAHDGPHPKCARHGQWGDVMKITSIRIDINRMGRVALAARWMILAS